MFLNKEEVAMLVSQINPPGIELYSYTETFYFVLVQKHAHITTKKGISFQNIGQNNTIVLPLFDHSCFFPFLLILVAIYRQNE